MKWYGLFGLFFAVVTAWGYWGYTHKKQFNFPSEAFFSTYGLDVSHHQGEVDWQKVSKTKFKFVYLKATEGESFKDKRFLQNYAQAKQAGLVVGGYHFWTFCKTAEEQIKNIKETVPHSMEDLVPAIDIESAYACGVEKHPERVTADVQKMNSKILEAYGTLPVIYTTREFVKVHPEILEFQNVFWLRSLIGPPLYKKKWGVWQYYNGAKVSGITGPVDVNVLSKKLRFDRITQR